MQYSDYQNSLKTQGIHIFPDVRINRLQKNQSNTSRLKLNGSKFDFK